MSNPHGSRSTGSRQPWAIGGNGFAVFLSSLHKNRAAFVGAIVMGDEVLLGAIPMEDMEEKS